MISSDPDASNTPVGAHQRLGGRYLLTRFVAAGGMAAVWEAGDEVLGRRVAVKILHPHLAADPAFLARFRAEARAAARLSQASIVAIFDTVSEPGVEAIVMEFVDAITLRGFLDGFGPLPIGDAVDLAIHVTEALDAAHDAHIVHRDIKPANILMCPDRRVKVTDFGIAKALEEEDQTTQGTLLGTAKYLSPEQVAGEPVDIRADIYSLGIVLYEALTGAVPFDEATPAATALARLHRDPAPIRPQRDGISPELEAVVLTALARDPDDRYPTAAAMRAALLAAVRPPTPVAAAPDVDATLVASVPDDTKTMSRPTLADGRTQRSKPTSAHGTDVPSPPMMAPSRDHLRGLVVLVVVLGSLGLGLALILGTSAGRDLADQIRDNLSGDPDTGNDAGPGSSPDGAPAVDAADQTVQLDGDAGGDVRVVDFDPEGDGGEHGDRVSLVLDANPNTFWHSERYDNRALGNLKSGVGLIFEVDSSRPLRELTVESPTRGWAASVFVSDAPHQRIADWGRDVDRRSDIDGSVTFDLRRVVGSHVLLWITDLGDELPRPRIEIVEIAVS